MSRIGDENRVMTDTMECAVCGVIDKRFDSYQFGYKLSGQHGKTFVDVCSNCMYERGLGHLIKEIEQIGDPDE